MKYLLLVIITLIVLGFATAQIGNTVPIIPPQFTVVMPLLPPPLPNQIILNSPCQYTGLETLQAVQVYNNELGSFGFGNLTYEFQISSDMCQKSFHRNIQYSVLTNPVDAIQNDLSQTMLNSIGTPTINTPIANGIVNNPIGNGVIG